MGAVSHSTNYYAVHPGNTPANHPPTEACMIHSKQHRGCGIQDPGTRGKHQTQTQNPWCTSRGCGLQNSGPTCGYRWWKTADFSHSAGTAHGAPPMKRVAGGLGKAGQQQPNLWQTICISFQILPEKAPPLTAASFSSPESVHCQAACSHPPSPTQARPWSSKNNSATGSPCLDTAVLCVDMQGDACWAWQHPPWPPISADPIKLAVCKT